MGWIWRSRRLSQSHFVDRLTGHTHTGGHAVQLLHHPEGEVDVDALDFQSLPPGLAETQCLKNRFAVIKASIEVREMRQRQEPR